MRTVRNKLKFILPLIALFSAILGLFSVSALSYFQYDDRSPYLSYTSSNKYYSYTAYNGTVSRLSYGNSVSFTMYGDYLYIYACSNTNSVRASVFVDGYVVGYTDNIGTSLDIGDPQLVFSASSLGSGEHFVSIVATTQYYQNNYAGYFYLDSIEVCKSLDTSSMYQIYILISLYSLLGICFVYMCIKFGLWRLTSKND